jgi:hypothetical protein
MNNRSSSSPRALLTFFMPSCMLVIFCFRVFSEESNIVMKVHVLLQKICSEQLMIGNTNYSTIYSWFTIFKVGSNETPWLLALHRPTLWLQYTRQDNKKSEGVLLVCGSALASSRWNHPSRLKEGQCTWASSESRLAWSSRTILFFIFIWNEQGSRTIQRMQDEGKLWAKAGLLKGDTVGFEVEPVEWDVNE